MNYCPLLAFALVVLTSPEACSSGILIDDFLAGPIPGSGSISSDGPGSGTIPQTVLVTDIDRAHNLWGERRVSVSSFTPGETASATFGPDLTTFAGGGMVLDVSPLSSAQFGIGYGRPNIQSFDLTGGDSFSLLFTEAPTSGSLYMFAYEFDGRGNWRHQNVVFDGPGEYILKFDDFSEEFSGTPADMTRVGNFFVAINLTTGGEAQRVVLSEIRVVPEPAAATFLLVSIAGLTFRRRRP